MRYRGLSRRLVTESLGCEHSLIPRNVWRLRRRLAGCGLHNPFAMRTTEGKENGRLSVLRDLREGPSSGARSSSSKREIRVFEVRPLRERDRPRGGGGRAPGEAEEPNSTAIPREQTCARAWHLKDTGSRARLCYASTYDRRRCRRSVRRPVVVGRPQRRRERSRAELHITGRRRRAVHPTWGSRTGSRRGVVPPDRRTAGLTICA